MAIKPVKPPTFKPAQLLNKLNILVYGGTGVGKTHFIGTAAQDPRFGRILLIAADPGTTTLAFSTEANNNIDIAPVGSIEEIDAWYAYLLENEAEYQTVAIDGFTDVGELALQEALRSIHANDSSRDLNKPDIDHWNRVSVTMRRIVRQFRDLQCYFICTALAQDKTDALGGLFTLPSVSGKLAAELGAYVDIIGYLYAETNKTTQLPERFLRFSRTDRIQAKDRTKRLPAVMKDPSLPTILEEIEKNVENPGAVVPELRPKFKQVKIGK